MHEVIGWVLRRPWMPRWIGRTAWFKRHYCLCGRAPVNKPRPLALRLAER